jgi:hypothetical protein
MWKDFKKLFNVYSEKKLEDFLKEDLLKEFERTRVKFQFKDNLSKLC